MFVIRSICSSTLQAKQKSLPPCRHIPALPGMAVCRLRQQYCNRSSISRWVLPLLLYAFLNKLCFRVVENYENLWSRKISGSRPVSTGKKWSKGQELTKLQAKVLELDIALEVNITHLDHSFCAGDQKYLVDRLTLRKICISTFVGILICKVQQGLSSKDQVEPFPDRAGKKLLSQRMKT